MCTFIHLYHKNKQTNKNVEHKTFFKYLVQYTHFGEIIISKSKTASYSAHFQN